ncbi:MAG: AI-2E family transporter [Pyrinomonadaceae bacterium]|nr:AI-2E family transporter [Pyrinomonadaceae bacterium]
MVESRNRRKRNLRQERKNARRIFIDPSSPSIRSIIRVVLIAMLILVLAALLSATLYLLSFLLFLIVLSIFFAYLLDPLVGFIRKPFEQRHLEKIMPRPLAIVISYLLVFTVLGIAIANLLPLIATQIRDFAENLPNYAGLIETRINALSNRYDQLMISPEVQKQINENIAAILGNLGAQITTIAGNTAISIATYLPWMLLIPILAFFFLKDASLFRSMFLGFFPSGTWRARASSFITDVNKTLAAYTRAQLISCLLIGSICTLAFTLIGLDYALLLGIIAGVFEFIPMLGPLTIGITAVLVGAFSDNPWQALWTAVFLITLRLTHDYVTYPKIVRDGIHLHPLAVVLSVLAGEQIAGIPGVFLSIPIVALVSVLYKHILEYNGNRGVLGGIFRSRREDRHKKLSPETDAE